MAELTNQESIGAPQEGPELRKERSLINELFSDLPVAVYTCDAEGYIISFNKEAEVLWGRKPLVGKDRWTASRKIFHPDGHPLSPEETPMARSLKNKIAIEGEEIIIQRPDDTLVNVLPYPRLIFGVSGQLLGAINTLVDVTEQRKGETKQAMLAAIIESSEDAIISKTLKGIITSWNGAAEKLFGYTEQEMTGKSITLLIPAERMEEERLILEKVSNNIRVEHYETYRLTKDGRQIPVSLTISPIRNAKGRIIGASKIARNILKQKEAEVRLLRYAENLEILYSVSKMVSSSLSAEDILHRVTDATTQLTGADFGIFIYNWPQQEGSVRLLSAQSGSAGNKVSLNRITDPGSGVFHLIFRERQAFRVSDKVTDTRCAGKSPFEAMLNELSPFTSYLAMPVISKSGDLMGGLFYGHTDAGHFTLEHENLVAGVAAQATIALENARLYEQVYELNSKKDEFIGLASHELKTPVTSLKAYLQIIDREFPKENTVFKTFVRKALLQTDKLLSLISDLLDVSKIEAGKLRMSFTRFDLQALAAEVIELMQHSFLTHKITLTCEAVPVMIRADKQRIEQVIINLLSNALKYSPNEGSIEVCVSGTDNGARVSVRDFGIGINEEQLEHIFSRFYRVETKDTQVSGLGIGLYLSKEIIDRHNGTFHVESEPGKGSVFSFEIPEQAPDQNIPE